MPNDFDDLDDEASLPDDIDVEEEVEVQPKRKTRKYRATSRARTIAPKELLRNFKKALLQPVDEELSYPEETIRPVTRDDCINGVNEQRPCPFVSCEHHLYMDVNKETGAIKMNFPHLEVWELKETCCLDVADRGGITLEEVGEIMNLTRERIRQVEVRGLAKAGFARELEHGCHVCGGQVEELENLDGTPGRVFGCINCDREIKELL